MKFDNIKYTAKTTMNTANQKDPLIIDPINFPSWFSISILKRIYKTNNNL